MLLLRFHQSTTDDIDAGSGHCRHFQDTQLLHCGQPCEVDRTQKRDYMYSE